MLSSKLKRVIMTLFYSYEKVKCVAGHVARMQKQGYAHERLGSVSKCWSLVKRSKTSKK